MKRERHARLRFLDEAGATTVLTRLYARAVGGERTTEAVPRNYGTSTSMISTMGIGGAEATMIIEGSVDTVVFNTYCQEVLRPTLQAGDLIVLDNLGAQRASRIEDITRSCGARVILRDNNGVIKIALTNPFGYYRFLNVSVNSTYMMECSNKQRFFAQRNILVEESTELVNFQAS